MKKLFKFILTGIAFVAVVFGILLFWAQRAGSGQQEKFFTAVLSGNPQEVFALFHPAMTNSVDLPVLEAWMKEFKEQLGDLQGLSKADFSTSAKYEDGAKIVDSSGTVNFTKGTAKSKLELRDGQIISFDVASDKIPADWFHGPAKTDFYRDKGKDFLSKLLTNHPDEVFQMMHEALQKEMPLEKTKEVSKNLTAQIVKLDSIEPAGEDSQDEGGYELVEKYTVNTQKGVLHGIVKFQFVGMKGHIVGFNVSSRDDSAKEQLPENDEEDDAGEAEE